MAYKFSLKDPTVTAGLRRIATEQIDAALADIDNPAMDLHDKVHQLRKRAKKLRGLIRLVRPVFPAFDTENAAIRDAARHLSGLRDREGMIETHDKLMAALAPDPAEYNDIRGYLTALKDQAAAHHDTAADIDAFRRELVALRARVPGWTLRQKGAKALRGGLVKTLKRARAGRKRVVRSATTANVHDWRKRVKYHWYHNRLLAPIHPKPMTRRAHAARDLGEMLGNHHDLDVLRAFLDQAADLPGDAARLGRYKAMIHTRQMQLEKQATALGAQLLAQTPAKLGKRWSGWWKDWR